MVFDQNNLIFFDNKGSILKFDQFSKLIWKKNYYKKSEKKLKPLLHMASHENYLIVTDNLAKYYVIDIEKKFGILKRTVHLLNHKKNYH